MWELIALLGMGISGWWVWDGISTRERAIVVARRACAEQQQQLLDETVEQIKLRFARTSNGSLLPKRTYRFEFTDDADARHHGELTLHAGRVTDLHLALPTFTVIEGSVASSEPPVQ